MERKIEIRVFRFAIILMKESSGFQESNKQ